MSDILMVTKNSPTYVIADGDEGVQINTGTRLGFAGAGFQLEGFNEVVKILKKILNKDLRVAASAESDWFKKRLSLDDWEQVDAMAQQHLQALADQERILYAGFLPFADPQEINHGIKGHMVRPRGVHLANKICFTLGGGEQIYNLGQYLISADWVAEAKPTLAKKIILQQVEFYQKLAKTELKYVYQTGGALGKKTQEKNLAVLKKIGF